MSFFDGGNKSLSFGERGDNTWRGKWQGGRILNISEPKTAMDFNDPSKPKLFKSGDPVKKIIITLDTRSGRFPAPPLDAEDDGIRDWHLDKGFGQYKAVGKALRDAKLKDLEVGGELYVCWTTGEGAKGDPRQFQAAYQAPVGTGGFMEDATAAALPAAPPAPVFPPQQPVAPPSAPFPAQVAAPTANPAPYGFDPVTGQPLAAPPQQPAAAPNPAPYGYDPATGQPLTAPPAQAPQFPAPQQPVPAAAGPVTNPFAQ